jgi:chromosome segregation ATPase
VPADRDGRLVWSEAELLDREPELASEPPPGMVFPPAAPPELGRELGEGERELVRWRARRPVEVLANRELGLAAGPDESREDFVKRCRAVADRADDATQERARERYGKRIATVKRRLERERDELERDRQQLASRRLEEGVGLVEGLLNVLLGSSSLGSASRKAASRAKTAAGKRRMRQSAESSVTESEQEIERLQDEVEALADELQEEVDRIADASAAAAERVELVPVRPLQRDVAVDELIVVWQGGTR